VVAVLIVKPPWKESHTARLLHPVPQEPSIPIQVERVHRIAYPVALARLLLLRVQNYIQHAQCVLLERGLLVELDHAHLVWPVNIPLPRLRRVRLHVKHALLAHGLLVDLNHVRLVREVDILLQ
jgi:hypothetical protein